MIFEYGSHRHPNAEVAITSTGKVARKSARGVIYAYDLSMGLGLTIRSTAGADQLAILAAQLERVYSVQNQRATLYTNTGRVAFRFDPAQSLNGVQIDSFVYPDVTGAAMVTTLKVEINLSMLLEMQGVEEILEFEERIDIEGGLPKVIYLPTSLGPSTRQTTQRFTPYVATQSGMSIGRRGRLPPPPYAFPNADVISRRIGKVSPSKLKQGVYREFSTTWHFVFMSNQPLNAEPFIL